MRIEFRVTDEVHIVESDEPISVNELLRRVGLQPSTVLVATGGTVIPHTTLIKSDVKLEGIIVSSGG
jgi:sulfur carrier protein ThiS